MNAKLPILNQRFRAPGTYSKARESYSLLPFRFTQLDGDRYVLSNLVGEYLVVSRTDLVRIADRSLRPEELLYDELLAQHFILNEYSDVALDLLAVKYRTKHALLPDLTSLFMFVTTLRCEHACPYCQVSRVSDDRAAFDMSPDVAERAVKLMFASPSPRLKVELQGGEPLLNFERLRQIVELVEAENVVEQRDVAFVVATNLALLNDEHLEYFAAHRVDISTSLDGPQSLHDANRPRRGNDSHQRALDGIERARAVLGRDRVSALMTTTEASLSMPVEIIDEYVRLGFDSIFLRPLSPYGFAVKTRWANHYDIERWLDFYWRGLEHILELNRAGIRFREEYAGLVLRRLLTPFPTSYVDLQSPAGIGLSAMVFNYDGAVYASDESRMLAEMGDQTFRIGHVAQSTFAELLTSEKILAPVLDSMLEGAPMCSDCAFLPYCGSDPVFHHATQGDAVGFKPSSAFCRKNMSIMRGLISRLEERSPESDLLRSWA
jgi:His-Xaa-Ser system radical SAM maturase HxsB